MSASSCVICALPITVRAKFGRPLAQRTTCSAPCRTEDNRRRNRATPQSSPTCTYCAAVLVYAGSGTRPTCCWHPDCRRQYGHDRAKAYQERKRTGAPPLPRGRPAECESTEHVDRLVAAAERRRKRHERAIGRRIFTITDGWAQKPGRSTIDGELRASEVAS
jgi:hypothetical protein